MGLLRTILQWLGGVWSRLASPGAGGGRYLCDSCRFDYGDACSRPERPNARRCPDYRRR